MMNERGKSDRPLVPVKSSNKAEQPAAEGMEGRGLTYRVCSERRNCTEVQSSRSRKLIAPSEPHNLEVLRLCATRGTAEAASKLSLRISARYFGQVFAHKICLPNHGLNFFVCLPDDFP
jgi:hypothetical protein